MKFTKLETFTEIKAVILSNTDLKENVEQGYDTWAGLTMKGYEFNWNTLKQVENHLYAELNK